MTQAPETTAAFDEFVELLRAARDDYVLSAERAFDESEAAEGYHYILQLISLASQLFVEGDPERPRFSSIVSPERKFLGDNPDAIYHQALIRGDRRYRIRGIRDEQTYLSFTVHDTGGFNGAVLADVNDRDLHIEPDGSFEVTLSATEAPGNWIRLAPDARLILVRSYYQRELSAQNDPYLGVRLAIEPLDDPGPSAPLDDATAAQRLRDAATFIRDTTFGLRVFGTPSNVPFVANEPNTVGTPWSFRNSNVDVAGAVDIWYSTGSFALEPDEALVMEGVLPPGAFVNVVLWNVHMQTLDYRTHRIALNGAQIETDADSRYRVVIAARDPGVPNWIDTCGHRRGTIFWRFLLPDTDPETPRCTVVQLGTL
jgi:hypothetical protein